MLEIIPQTKVGELLDSYPELEETLIAMAPAFKKLKNPVLRKTVGRVTSLNQAAKVGNVPLFELVNTLRAKTGQPPLDIQGVETMAGEPPAWFKNGTIVDTIDARPMLEEGKHPVGIVLTRVETLTEGQILELITTFTPAPLIDKVTERGFHSWGMTKNPADIRTYFCKK